MPYKRRYKKSKGAFAKLKKNVNTLMKKVRGKEVRMYDGEHLSASITNAGNAPVLLTAIAGGTTEKTRTGNDAQHLSSEFRGALFWNSSATVVGQRVRVIVVRQQSNTAPAYAGVFAAAGIDYFHSVDFQQSSRILLDRSYTLSAQNPLQKLKLRVKRNFKVEWSSGTDTDVAFNNVYLMVISDTSINHPTILGRWRVKFYND